MRTLRPLIPAILGFVAGVGIAFVDTRPTWDDAGVTAAAVFLVAAIVGAARPRSFWIGGLAVGLPVLALNAILHGNYGSAIAVAIAVLAAAAGAMLGKVAGFGADTTPEPPRESPPRSFTR
ncbi:MAG TPA: hypothetical protein VKH19_19015 [Gemmatimonadaceae bacterium]|nr:hypothetical protein [Gemmatimonadaceae bacterium]